MRTFLSFCSEARTSRISDQAERAGLTGDGHGNWFDNQGNMVAKTERGKLSYLIKETTCSTTARTTITNTTSTTRTTDRVWCIC